MIRIVGGQLKTKVCSVGSPHLVDTKLDLKFILEDMVGRLLWYRKVSDVNPLIPCSPDEHRNGDQKTDYNRNNRGLKSKVAPCEKCGTVHLYSKQTGSRVSRDRNAKQAFNSIPSKMQSYGKPQVPPP